MLTNYLKIALRTLRKKPFYTGINILGLAIGMAACLLISLYVLDELSYDRFHEKADRIYRVTTLTTRMGSTEERGMAATNYHIGEVIDDEIPEVETTVRVHQEWEQLVKHAGEIYPGARTLAVDSTFFRVFTFPLSEGNPETALREPASVVLTERLAKIIFGRSRGVVGNTLTVAGQFRKVTAVAENPPANAHFHFDLLLPIVPRVTDQVNWFNVNATLSTYFLLAEGASVTDVPNKIYQLLLKYNPKAEQFINEGKAEVTFSAQPLTDIHLHSDLRFELKGNSDIRYVYIFSAIALFILVIAIINFVNLATARSADRAKEVGVRKTLGSVRSALVGQFMAESLLVSFIAMLLALGLAEIFRRPFNELAAKSLTLSVTENGSMWVAILVIAVVVGVIAGLYPALYLTKFRPVDVLRGRLSSSRRGRKLRNLLVVFQFATTIGLIVCTGLVYQQLQYLQNKSLGYTKKNVIMLPNKLGAGYDAFMNEVGTYPQVLSTTASQQSPHLITNGQSTNVKGSEESYQIKRAYGDYDFLSTYDIELSAGRYFDPRRAGDTARMVLNEAAVRMMNIDEPIGALVQRGRDYLEVIGVVKDFHFQSLRSEIAPLMILLSYEDWSNQQIAVRISGQDVPGTLAFLQSTWEKYATDAPFTYSFLDQDYESLYRAESRLSRVFGIFTGLAIFVACLGLLALAAFLAEQRTKEIGIRKVMGASVRSIVLLLSKGFTRLVLIAFVIAIPLAYWAMQTWLSDFAYRIEISAWPFLLAGGVALLIAWLTISYQSIKAALSNPVDALRDE